MRRFFLLLWIVAFTLPAGEVKAPAPEETKPAAAELVVYVTDTGHKYHREKCRYLKQSSNKITLSEAKKKYTPCKVCKPQE
jgi:competence protein ComEC